MRLFRIALVCLALLFLGSCGVLQYIFGSIFPSTLTLAKAQADLSGLIEPDFGNSFSVRVVETGVYGYVVIAGSTPMNGNVMYFYDLDLNPKLTLTSPTLTGTGVMSDVNGQIKAGNILLNADLSSPVTQSSVVGGNAGIAGNDGVVFSTLNNLTNFYCPGSSFTLSYTSYLSTWTTGTLYTPVLSSIMSNLQVNAVLDDGNPTGNVILVFGQSGSSGDVTRYFVTLNKTDLVPPGIFPTSPLDSAPHRDNINSESLGFAQGSIMAFDSKSSSYVRINPADGSTQSSFYTGTRSQQPRFAYRVSGGSFYGFDTRTRILTKYSAWW